MTQDAPVLRVVRGEPTPHQLAALVAVLATRSYGPAELPAAPHSAWGRPGLRAPLSAGVDAWRTSGLPR